MKKILLISLLCISAMAASAQPRAIGIRGGWNTEASYQHSLSEKTYLQADLGLVGLGYGVQAVGTYNWILAQPQWTSYGTWEWFAGLGAGVGAWWRNSKYFYLGVAGNVGLAYTFEFPLQVSADLRPLIGTDFHGLFSEGWFYPALSIRYKF